MAEIKVVDPVAAPASVLPEFQELRANVDLAIGSRRLQAQLTAPAGPRPLIQLLPIVRALTDVAATEAVINALKLKMNSTGHHRNWAWLCQQIRQVPRYRLQGPLATTPSNVGLLPVDVQRWIDRTWPLFQGVSRTDLPIEMNAIMFVLATPGGTRPMPGLGGSSRIYYDPRKNFFALGVRPAYVGLTHELVHAYYNMRGEQLSHSEDSTHFSTVLYEFLCVGLGPWAGAAISENALRNDIPVGMRARCA